jgi:protein-disulfide isomerase
MPNFGREFFVNRVALVLCLAFAALPILEGECSPISAATRHAIVSYVAGIHHLPDTGLEIALSEDLVACYRKLTFTGPRLQPFVLFLSPDQRFLSPQVYDIERDPAQVRHVAERRAEGILLQDPSPSRGELRAPVTVVVFADFECPTCKRFHEWMSSLPDNIHKQLRLVHKNLPLSTHPWARRAALIATCGRLQSDSLFWPLHDFFFREQNALTPLNIDDKTRTFTAGAIDQSSLSACVNTGLADSLVERDIALAHRLNVFGTPAIFLNGQRLSTPQSAEELTARIKQAIEEAPVTVGPVKVDGGEKK